MAVLSPKLRLAFVNFIFSVLVTVGSYGSDRVHVKGFKQDCRNLDLPFLPTSAYGATVQFVQNTFVFCTPFPPLDYDYVYEEHDDDISPCYIARSGELLQINR